MSVKAEARCGGVRIALLFYLCVNLEQTTNLVSVSAFSGLSLQRVLIRESVFCNEASLTTPTHRTDLQTVAAYIFGYIVSDVVLGCMIINVLTNKKGGRRAAPASRLPYLLPSLNILQIKHQLVRCSCSSVLILCH